ncbi:MAG: DNA replication/repair protein RecF [Methyloligellaceae bacterium]
MARLGVENFRNHQLTVLTLDERPVVLTGGNGAGKTNLLEAVSLLAPGRGLRGSAYSDLDRFQSGQSWALSAQVQTRYGEFAIQTRGRPQSPGMQRGGRTVTVDGAPAAGSGALADYLDVSWLTPAMDGLFTGPAAERRHFLDRLSLCVDPGHRKRITRFDRAMRQRNKLLEMNDASPLAFEGLEMQMAELGVAMAAARLAVVRNLNSAIVNSRENCQSAFPWAVLDLDGLLEAMLEHMPAVDVEDAYRRELATGRAQDCAARRTLKGPHRSDLIVCHGPKDLLARTCSTGEQKALLVGLVLAHARLVKQINDGFAPIVLLDEIAAHFDISRREALFEDIQNLGMQAWMTGTDGGVFSAFGNGAQFFKIADGSALN